MYLAKILADSLSPHGVRLTTLEVEYPHAVHKDIMTHRMLSRNFQSFRAIPSEILLDTLEAGGFFIPEVFGHRVKGMGQRNEPVNGQDAIDQAEAREIWLQHAYDTIAKARKFIKLGVAKQQVNFLLQDLCWIRGLITATDWDNFYALRLATDATGQPVARPEVYKIASMMRTAMDNSRPVPLGYGEWHLPFNTDGFVTEGESIDNLKKISVGRSARISYLTHDGVRNPLKDIQLHDRLLVDGHMSPFEHVARPLEGSDDLSDARGVLPLNKLARSRVYIGNFRGWVQYRKEIEGESNFAKLQGAN